MSEEQKIQTPLEALDQLIQEGENMILSLKNQIVKAEVMDRLGKRLLLRGPKFQLKVGQNQQNLSNMQSSLKSMEEADADMKRLKVDMLEESKKESIVVP